MEIESGIKFIEYECPHCGGILKIWGTTLPTPFICDGCGKLIEPEHESGDEQSNNADASRTTGVTFIEGGFEGSVIVRVDPEITLVCVPIFFGEPIAKVFRTPADLWQRLLHSLYDDCHVSEWKDDYFDPNVIDGTEWEFRLNIAGASDIVKSGSNDFPETYEQMRGAFTDILRIGGFPAHTEYRKWYKLPQAARVTDVGTAILSDLAHLYGRDVQAFEAALTRILDSCEELLYHVQKAWDEAEPMWKLVYNNMAKCPNFMVRYTFELEKRQAEEDGEDFCGGLC